MKANLQQPAAPPAPPGSTRIAVSSWSLRPGTPQQLLNRLLTLDIQAVQLALSPMVSDPETWGEAVQELRAGGVWVASGMMAMAGEDYSTLESIARTGGVRPDQTWFANRAHAEQVARLACTSGIGLVTFHGGFIPEDRASPLRAKMFERLKSIAETFGHYGVALALETGQESAQTLNRALDDLACPNIGVNFDPANMILYGMGDPVDALAILAMRVRQIHIKDAVPSAKPGVWGREVPVGQGQVDWDRFFEIALMLNPPVQFVIEREARSAADADLLAAKNLIARHLQPTKP